MSKREERRPSLPARNPPASTATAADPLGNNLADRLDLLEARLRMPTAPPLPQQQQQQHSTIPADEVSLLASLGSPSISQHSFKFDTPSLSRSSETIGAAPSTSNGFQAHSSPSLTIPSSVPGHSTSLEAVSRAAEQHMRKIASTLENSQSGASPLGEGIMASFSNSSYQTVKRSHRTDQHATYSDKVVKESPHVLVESGATTKANNPRALVMANQQSAANRKNSNNDNSKASKRKSTPVKLEVSEGKPRKQSTNTSNSAADDGARKRTRLQFTGKNNLESNGNPKDATMSINTNSRSNHTPIKGSGTKHKAPKNNRLIRDFFTAVRSNTNTDADATEKPSQPTSGPEPKTPLSTRATTTAESPNQDATPSPIKQVVQLQKKCQQMEQLCHEKDAQLKAVSNNRTIMQTAVQSALKQREAELGKVKKSFSNYRGQVNSVIENLMRQQALQDAQRVRERLAADATRLGRIVYTRAGMRSVETWEEGTASRRLQERREKLLAQRSQLEQRQQRARTAAQFILLQPSDDKENNTKATPPPNETVEGILVKSNLDALEAVESVRFHLETVQRKLRELEAEEKRLKQEKVEHLRAWKRLASEDASLFRDRPKLHNRYVLMALLGKGGFSEVWRAYDVEELQEVAVKIHQLDPRWSDEKKENYTKHVSREYEIHRNVRHPRIVSLLDVFEVDTNSFCTVLELCDGTDLETVLKQKSRLPERDSRAILLQILSGMNYLSHPSPDGRRQAIIHYDLKPGNILFDDQGDAKITDFGLSKIVETHDPGQSMELTSQGAGTYWYLPPECFIVEENVAVRISNKVDVWSIGVIYYQMLYGRRPFGHGKSQDRLLTDHTMLNAKEVIFPEEPLVSVMGKEFIRNCLQYDQLLRPTVAQLCESPYVTSSTFS